MQIKFDNISFTYNRNLPSAYCALTNVSLSIKEGSFTAIVGQTGSGKSTLLQHINGLLLPSSGKIAIGNKILCSDKKQLSKNYKEIRKDIGMVFQFPENQLFEETVYEDIAFGLKNFGYKDGIDQMVKEALYKVGLDDSYLDRSPFELSGGEKRKVAIAGILATNPSVLVLDEPTAGLDTESTCKIMSLFKELQKKGVTVIIVTHDMDVVLKYSTNAIVLDKGKVVYDGSTSDLFNLDIQKYHLTIPQCLEFAKEIKSKHCDINLKNVYDIDSLIDEIVKAKK